MMSSALPRRLNHYVKLKRRALVVVQARLGSSRLPGKALLPIGNMPIVVLAAKRAGNTELPVRVATSNDRLDDPLVKALLQHGLEVKRGALDDVLGRFVMATEDLPDQTTIVRLTGDNVFPDGALIEELLAFHESADYTTTDSISEGLPYGLSAEAFKLAVLRQAAGKATTDYDREHVTPWIRRYCQRKEFHPKTSVHDLSSLRCTIDDLADYRRIADIFYKVTDPIKVSWQDLCELLSVQASYPRVASRSKRSDPVSQLTLGTAQLGITNYGRTNAVGRPGGDTAVAIVREAIEHGVSVVDTARAYDRSEEIVSRALRLYGDRIRVITKLDPLDGLDETAGQTEVRNAVDASIYRSCRELRVAEIPVLLLHRWRHFSACGGRIWQRLLELKSHSVIAALGASVSTPQEAKEALEEAEIKHLQLPFNLLDKRWVTAGIDRLARERPDVTIYARSVLLQGILVGSPTRWPQITEVSAEIIVKRICELTKQLNRVNRVDLCIAFVRGHDWIDSLVIGMESVSQLHDLIGFFQRPALSQTEVELVTGSFGPLPETLLNPALWNVK